MMNHAGEKGRHSPVRTCLGCRRARLQVELKRLALAGGEGARVVWDEGRRLGGRGAWICLDSPECLAAAIKKRSFNRAFKRGDLDLSSLE